MKRKIDWLQFGQYLTLVNELWTVIRDEFKKRKITPEILEWLTKEGKEVFKEFLATLAERYTQFMVQQKCTPEQKPQPLIAEVDLDVDPQLPFTGATLVKHVKQGKVCVEYRADEDELYVNGKKVVPWLSKEQLAGGSINGKTLQVEAEKNNPINATLADWLYQHQEFIPKKWKGRVWYFWASEWSDSGGGRHVRYLYWDGTWWYRDYGWLEFGWYAYEPSASLAS